MQFSLLQSSFILYVKDQLVSTNFYAKLFQCDPVLHVPGMTEFELQAGVKLGLMPEDGIAKMLGASTPHPNSGTGIPRCELYLIVKDLSALVQHASELKIETISELALRDWGHRAIYYKDPDGHVIAFAETVC